MGGVQIMAIFLHEFSIVCFSLPLGTPLVTFVESCALVLLL